MHSLSESQIRDAWMKITSSVDLCYAVDISGRAYHSLPTPRISTHPSDVSIEGVIEIESVICYKP